MFELATQLGSFPIDEFLNTTSKTLTKAGGHDSRKRGFQRSTVPFELAPPRFEVGSDTDQCQLK